MASKKDRKYVNGYVDDTRDGDAKLVLLYRDDAGKLCQQQERAEWISFFKLSDLDELNARRTLRSAKAVKSYAEQGEWARVGFQTRQLRQDYCFHEKSPLRSIPSFEGDVDPVRRYFSDTGAQVARPGRAYLDIETDSRKTFAEAKDGKARVVAWTITDASGTLKAFTGRMFHDVLQEDSDAAEEELLSAMWDVLEEFDQVVAWNGDEFDYPVIWKRSSRVGIVKDVRRWVWLDHLKVYRRMNLQVAKSGDEKMSFKLENVAQQELGEGKDDFDASKTWEAWAAGGKQRLQMQRYNMKDTDLLRRIEIKSGFIELFITLCEICRLFADSRALHPTRQMDGFLLRMGVERSYHFPSLKYGDEDTDHEKFKGAFVMQPTTNGIAYSVHVADFASLYPSIMLTWNMSPETKAPQMPVNGPIPPGHCRSPATGIGFSTGRPGLLSDALKAILRERKYWNDLKASLPPGTPEWYEADRKSSGYKTAANSFYGGVGSIFSRYFDRSIAESVTQNGAWLIKRTIAEGQKPEFGIITIYGDTDSFFACLPDVPHAEPCKWCARMACGCERFAAFVKHCNENVYPEALKRQGCTENHIKLAYEKAFDRIVICTAKKYAGSYLHYKGKPATKDSKPEIKGLEYKRGDAALLARRLQSEVIDLLVGGLKIAKVPVPSNNLEDYHDVLRKMREHVLSDTLPINEVVLSKSLSKKVNEYAVKKKDDGQDAAQPPHVTVAKILQARGREVGESTRIEYVVTAGDASPMKVIPAEDYTGEEADRFYVWDSLVFPPTQRLLEAAFPDHDWKAWEKSRPAKVRTRKTKVDPRQLALPTDPPVDAPTVRKMKTPENGYVLRIDERKVANGGLAKIKEILKSYPGSRPVVMILHLANGAEVTLDIPMKVSGSVKLHAELQPFRVVTAA